MAVRLRRDWATRTVDVTGVLATTPRIGFGDFAGGGVRIPAGSTLTSLTFHVSESGEEGATFAPAYDRAGAAIVLSVAANRAYPLPEDLFGWAALKIVGNTAGQVVLCCKG